MKFFVPGTVNEEGAIKAWQQQREEREASHRQPLSDGKIFKILYDPDNTQQLVAAQVGQVNWIAQERVLAIFGPDDLGASFLVATANKTLTVSPEQIISIETFED